MAGLNRDRDELGATIHMEVKPTTCRAVCIASEPEAGKVDRLRASHSSDGTVAVPAGQILKTRRLIAFEVWIVTEEEQAFQSFGFEHDLVRYPLALALQVLDQPVDGLDDTPV